MGLQLGELVGNLALDVGKLAGDRIGPPAARDSGRLGPARSWLGPALGSAADRAHNPDVEHHGEVEVEEDHGDGHDAPALLRAEAVHAGVPIGGMTPPTGGLVAPIDDGEGIGSQLVGGGLTALGELLAHHSGTGRGLRGSMRGWNCGGCCGVLAIANGGRVA